MSGPACRWCYHSTDAEYVDVGVGYVQVSGGQCWNCGAYEMGPYMTDGVITEVEMSTLWLGPDEDRPEYSPFNPEQQECPK